MEAQLQGSLTNLDGSKSFLGRAIDLINTSFTLIFAAELLVNLFANWLRPFVGNSWSLFDFFVVVLSLITLGPLDLPISILRALRVLRLFGR